MAGPLRMAIVGGGGRGRSFLGPMSALSEMVVPVAVCDPSEAALKWWEENRPDMRRFRRYEELLDWGEFDAVLIASPVTEHARQAISALEAGKHVLSEVPAATTLDECYALVEASRKSSAVYMLAENYCYLRQNMMVLNMVELGLFGEVYYAEGGYIHDCRYLLFGPDGTLTWRGELWRTKTGNWYPTHSVGPVAQWLGIGKRDRFVKLTTFVTAMHSVPKYAAEVLGEDRPESRPEFWSAGDCSVTLLRTERGAVVVLRLDASSPRPHNMTHYALQGTKGAYVSSRGHGSGDADLVWIEGRSPGRSPGDASWEPLLNYADEFEHPKWRELGELAARHGHGGGDLLVLHDFIKSAIEGTEPPITARDAAIWSAIIPLSFESATKGGEPVEFPRF